MVQNDSSVLDLPVRLLLARADAHPIASASLNNALAGIHGGVAPAIMMTLGRGSMSGQGLASWKLAPKEPKLGPSGSPPAEFVERPLGTRPREKPLWGQCNPVPGRGPLCEKGSPAC